MAENRNDLNSEEKEIVSAEAEIEESTIFSAPAVHKDKRASGKYTRLFTILVCVLSVMVIGAGIYGVIKLIPDKEPEVMVTIEPEQVMSLNTATFNKITITHPGATLVLNSEIVEEDNASKQVWKLEGYDNTLIDSASLEQLAKYAAGFTSYGEYEIDMEKDAEAYGLNKPYITVDVETSDEVMGNYTITVGNDAPSGDYAYLHLSSVPNKVYLVQKGVLSGFVVEPLDIAISTAIPAIEKNDKNAGYFNSDGTLGNFDSITLSGEKFKTPLVFTPNKDERFSSYATYICTSPKMRIADGVIEDIRDIFGKGVAASGAVSFDQSKESLKKFGLDKPDIVITIKVAGKNYSYKLKATDSSLTEYYVAADTDRMIRTVTISNMTFLTNEEKDYYLGFMALEAISDISGFKLSGEVDAYFTLEKDEESDEGGYVIECNGKKVVSKSFQSFYAVFMQTTAQDYDTVSVSAKPDLTITLEHHDGSDDTVLRYYKISESRYQYSVGGIPMGQISSSAYSKIVREISKLVP